MAWGPSTSTGDVHELRLIFSWDCRPNSSFSFPWWWSRLMLGKAHLGSVLSHDILLSQTHCSLEPKAGVRSRGPCLQLLEKQSRQTQGWSMLMCPGWMESSPCPGLPLTLTVFSWGLFFSFFAFPGRPLYIWSNALCGQGTQQHPEGWMPKSLCHSWAGLFIVIAVLRDLWKWESVLSESSSACDAQGTGIKLLTTWRMIQTGRLFIPLFRVGKGCWGCSPIPLIHPGGTFHRGI